MNKFGANKNFLLFVLCAIFIAGCQPMKSTTDAPRSPNVSDAATAIRISAVGADAAEPAIAADADGNFYVVYVAHGAEKFADVYLQKYDAQMKASGEKTRVNSNAGEAVAWRGDPPTVAVGADKTVYVGWTRIVKSGGKTGTDLCLSVSRDGGKSFASPVKINDDAKPASHGMHSLAVGENGAIFMAWLDERNVKSEPQARNFLAPDAANDDFRFVKAHHNSNSAEPPKKVEKKTEAVEPNSEVFFAASNNGGKTFSANLKLSSEVCPCCKTSLGVAPDGRIYASWRQVLPGDFRHIAVASSLDAGKTFNAPTIVSDDRWQINACPVSGAGLAFGANGQLKVAWFTAGDAGKIGLYETESNDFGATFANRALVSEGEVSGTPIFSASGKLLWEADGKIYQTQPAANGDFNGAQLVSNGNLPSAVAVGAKFYVAFIKKETDKRVVWLAEF